MAKLLPPLPDNQPVAANALRNKRAEIAGAIALKQREIDQLRADLVHIDNVLRLFDPDLLPSDIPDKVRYPRRSDYFQRGELTRRVFDWLREKGDVSAGELAAEAMADKGFDPSDGTTRRDFAHRFGMCLHDLLRQKTVERIGRGKGVRWRLAPREPDLGIG